jgi:DNA-binding LacI/PurR family transcriptional regulator
MGKNTKTIGLLIPDIMNPFFSELARHIEDLSRDLTYNVVICNTDYQPKKEKEYVELLIQKNIDGFIIASGFEHIEIIEKIKSMKLPVILIARESPTDSLYSISINDKEAGKLGTEYLIENGHQDIAIIARDIWTNRQRYKGHLEAIKQHKLTPRLEHYYAKTSSFQDGYEGAKKILNESKVPSAIFAFNDLMAAGVVKACLEANLKIPDDMAILGFDNSSVSEIISPPLSTVGQPLKQIAERSVNRLIKSIETGIPPEGKEFLDAKIIKRSTS